MITTEKPSEAARLTLCSPGGEVRRRARNYLVRVKDTQLLKHAPDTLSHRGLPRARGARESEVEIDGLQQTMEWRWVLFFRFQGGSGDGHTTRADGS